jgi:predicted metal-dependent hydrolase
MCYNRKAMVNINRIIYSNRRSLAVEINQQGEVIVRAPRYISKERIARFVQSQENWIYKHLEQVRAIRNRYQPVTIAEGAVMPFFGRMVTLHLTDKKEICYCECEGKLLVPRDALLTDLKRWLSMYLSGELRKLVSCYADRMHVRVPSFDLSQARTRWGSCNCKGRLRFNWHLVFCHPAAVEYVVVHECCHLFYMHHDYRFWSLVESFLPDRKMREQWLKSNQGVMEIL